jgi:hypothetical protein
MDGKSRRALKARDAEELEDRETRTPDLKLTLSLQVSPLHDLTLPVAPLNSRFKNRNSRPWFSSLPACN